MALQFGLVHPSSSCAVNAVLEGEEVGSFLLPPLRIMLWARRMEMMSADDVRVYREGITGSHLAVGGMDRIIIPRHVSSFIAVALRLSMAAFWVWSSLIWSQTLAPSV